MEEDSYVLGYDSVSLDERFPTSRIIMLTSYLRSCSPFYSDYMAVRLSYTEGEGSLILRNVRNYSHEEITSKPRRLESSDRCT